MSHSMFTDAHKLLCDDSEGESSDEELLSSKVVAAVQYAAMLNTRFIFRIQSTVPMLEAKSMDMDCQSGGR
jgi:hypothetical protein